MTNRIPLLLVLLLPAVLLGGCQGQDPELDEDDLGTLEQALKCNGNECGSGGFFCGNTGCTAGGSKACCQCNVPLACGSDCGICPLRFRASRTCRNHTANSATACSFTCDPGYADADKNAANGCESCATGFWQRATDCAACTNSDHCGSNCAVCPARPNATRKCLGNTAPSASSCSFVCNANYVDANGLPGDGCEACVPGFAKNGSGVCVACNTAAACGLACTDCAASADGSRCVSGGCGCDSSSDCGAGLACVNKRCSSACTQDSQCGSGLKCCGPGGDKVCLQKGVEVCDGRDNDCDGVIDNGLGRKTCGTGACQRTVDSCVDGEEQSCVPGEPSPEICDGLDNDCNGEIDEGLGETTCGFGPCVVTVPACKGGKPVACVPDLSESGPETCNGLDDDCNGIVDDGPAEALCGPDQAHSTLTASPAELAPRSTAFLTARLFNRQGNAWEGAAPVLACDFGQLGAPQSNGKGSWTATLTSDAPGLATCSGAISGMTLSGRPTVRFTATSGRLVLEHLVPGPIANPGETLELKVVVRAEDPAAPLNGATLALRLPEGLRFVEGSLSAPGGLLPAKVSGNEVLAPLPEIGGNTGALSLTYRVTVQMQAFGTQQVVAEARKDGRPVSNAATAGFEISSSYDLGGCGCGAGGASGVGGLTLVLFALGRGLGLVGGLGKKVHAKPRKK